MTQDSPSVTAGPTTELAFGVDAPLHEVMRTMRAMRRLRSDPVDPALLTRLVEAASWAPSGGNVQAYSFVVVTSRDQMARLAHLWKVTADFYLGTAATVVPEGMSEPQYERMRRALRFQRDHFAETPAVIVACYDSGPWRRKILKNTRQLARAVRPLGPRRVVTLARNFGRFAAMGEAASVYPGVQNLLLTARALGLAATMTTWHQLLDAEFKHVLGIPAHVNTYALIPIGYPRGNFGLLTRKPAESAIHWDRW
jgi:nitroreductase